MYKEWNKIGNIEIVTQMYVDNGRAYFNDKEGFEKLKEMGLVKEFKNEFLNVYNLYSIETNAENDAIFCGDKEKCEDEDYVKEFCANMQMNLLINSIENNL